VGQIYFGDLARKWVRFQSALTTSPYDSVVFNSDTSRTDIETGYIAGYKVVNSQRLASIETHSGSNVVKTYQLHYDQNTPTGRSRIAWVKECAGDGITCLSPTNFTWESTPLTTYGNGISESPRLLRRLKSLRGLSHEEVEQVLTRGP
jgi:hypothetical protein